MKANRNITGTVLLLCLGVLKSFGTDAPPTIQETPLGWLICEGESATLAVQVTSTTPVTYQWRHDGTDIPMATNATLTLTNLQLRDAGCYVVAVSNSVGGVVTDPPAEMDIRPSLRILSAIRSGPNLTLTWTGRSPVMDVEYQVERTTNLGSAVWQPVTPFSTVTNATVIMDSEPAFYRISGPGHCSLRSFGLSCPQ